MLHLTTLLGIPKLAKKKINSTFELVCLSDIYRIDIIILIKSLFYVTLDKSQMYLISHQIYFYYVKNIIHNYNKIY